MEKAVIIADDLTGANAAGILLKNLGLRAATFLNVSEYERVNTSDYSVVSINTDSRGIDSKSAYKRVEGVMAALDPTPNLICKRIDSTFRGNIGAEIDAVLDNLDKDAAAIVVAAFPNSGRIAVGGYLMVNLMPLEKTDVAKDPKTPIKKSYVPDLIKNQSGNNVAQISLGYVLRGEDALLSQIIREKGNGNRIIVIDATSDEDIQTIASAVDRLDFKVVSVDPGPFTCALMKKRINGGGLEKNQKIMLAIGSVSNLTHRQLESLIQKYKCLIEPVDASALIYPESREKEIEDVFQRLIGEIDSYQIVGIATTSEEESVLDLGRISKLLNVSEDDVSQRIASGLAEITQKAVDASNGAIKGLYTSGGDVTVAVCNQLGISGIEIKDEVLPLAVYGSIIGEAYNELGIVTKGGLIGNDDAMIKCVEHLMSTF